AARDFRTTHWSLVLEAGVDTDGGRHALETLCRNYWLPLYAFVRRRGFGPATAEDLTQEFFARLLAHDGFTAASRERGRFRSFLLASLKNFLANEWDRSQRLKRGAGVEFLNWDELDAEARCHLEPAGADSNDTLFDREWAEALVNGVLARLRAEVERDSGSERFEALKGFLVTDAPASYAKIGARLGLSEAAVKSAIHRLRRRYAELLRTAVAETLDSASDVEDEIRHLFATLAA
ncbi:MAG TPA: sigma factor, partial [Candidatus Limnocylindria bacterium]|nr:sigma factor [Candidatus Limnocylindria bacterium]